MNKKRIIAVSSVGLFGLSLAVVALADDSPSDADKTFVANVSQGGMYEVEASTVAERRASAPDVKDVASTEVHDHDGVNAKLKKLADAAGIPMADKLNDKFQQRLDKLKGASDADFDAAYIEDMKGIHDNDEKLFAKEAQEGTGDFKTFAHETDLIVKRHIGALHGTDQSN
jgi:putative membrane protein